MCGIFGIIGTDSDNKENLNKLISAARQRGRDSSGFIYLDKGKYNALKADFDVLQLHKKLKGKNTSLILGHSRLITNGLNDNQPVLEHGVCVLHNGIIVNDGDLWQDISVKRNLQIDTEIIAAIFREELNSKTPLENIPKIVLKKCKGVIACAVLIPELGKLVLFSNNGSLYSSRTENGIAFSSEEYPLKKIGCKNIQQIKESQVIHEVPKSETIVECQEFKAERINLIPSIPQKTKEEALLLYEEHDLKRCTKCILPSTMPFIHFDKDGVCNYCNNYQLRNIPKPKNELFELVKPYRRKVGNECIVPFSGGRDSCYGLHLIVKELGLKPLTYTYDWGMVTDLGRRNISRMCSELGVENIIIADDITRKRRNIRMNIEAWLKNPHLGMISIFTAGDKHFFRHVETVKNQTGISLNLWGVNPLEVTHFKSGFLGVKPDFEEEHVYSNGALKQLKYQGLRFKAMLQSPKYFNSSLWDTISGEYYRSFHKKTDYFHLFDYWRWEEELIDNTLQEYDWEKAIDTNTTWRIGDGTAAFYNYIYYTVAGFTEHDTFRSNQIREGQLSREKALELVKDENRPRYQNIKWYLDAVNLDFKEVIETINRIDKLYTIK